MSGTLMSYLVASLIAGEVALFAILQAADRRRTDPGRCGLGWFYFALCVGMFGMAGTSLFAYIDTHNRLRDLDVLGDRYIACNALILTLTDMESSHRGFLLTGRGSYLEPYRKGLAAIPARCERLAAVYRGSGAEARAVQVCKLAGAKTKEMAASLSLREARRPDAALEQFNSDIGKNTMDLTRMALGELIQTDLGRYAAVKADLIRLAESRIVMALLVACGAIVQMFLGVFGGWKSRPPGRGEASPTSGTRSDSGPPSGETRP